MAFCNLVPANFSHRHLRHGSAPPFCDPKPRKNSPVAAVRGAPTLGEVERGSAVSTGRRIPSGLETRVSLVAALASQTFSLSQRVVAEFLSEAAKYAVPARRFGEPRNLEEALMSGLHSFFLWQQLWSFAPICLFFPFFFIFSNVYWYLQHLWFGLMAVPDLESVNFKVLKRVGEYEIREVESYFIAETTMPGKRGFDFNGSGQAFNVLAAYLFGKNTASEQMEMTTPVFTRKAQADGEKMEMTAPVITRKLRDEDNWQMSFVMPSKYGGNLPTPKDPSVRIREVPRKIVAVAAFSGFVTDDVVKDKELRLRDALRGDSEFQVKPNTPVEVAQFNPPFTLPFTRRNEVSLEVEKRQK